MKKKKLFLHGSWEFSQSGKNSYYKAKVPGCVHTDLLRADLIPDLSGENELELDWIEQRLEYDQPVPASILNQSMLNSF